jgi:hypothetical protein
MGYWEYAEYTFAVLVALACFGEYIADFTTWWQRGGIWVRLGPMEKRKDNLGKLSTLLLITSLVFETVCLFRTNQISGQVLGSLNNLSDEAFQKAAKAKDDAGAALTQSGQAKTKAQLAEDASGRATDKSSKAEEAASDAATLARGARKEADTFRQEIASAKQQVVALDERTAWRDPDRGLIPAMAEPLKKFAGQKYVLVVDSDPERHATISWFVILLGSAKWDLGTALSNSELLLPETNIVIAVKPNAPEKVVQAAKALVAAIGPSKLDPTFFQIPLGPQPEPTPDDVIRIIIFKKGPHQEVRFSP